MGILRQVLLIRHRTADVHCADASLNFLAFFKSAFGFVVSIYNGTQFHRVSFTAILINIRN